jgi:hypothetical protein
MRQATSRVSKLTKLTVASIALSVAACREVEEAPATSETAAATIVYASEGRDRLCLKEGEQRAGFITYAASGNANCSVRGSTDGKVIRPDGDASCAITMERDGDRLTLLAGGPACAYYCGPGADFANTSLVRMDRPEPVRDLAGDPIC